MAKIPIKFKRVAAAFDEAARWQPPCESSSGSDYWPESGTQLSDLVNSFIENGDHYYSNEEDHSFDIHAVDDISNNDKDIEDPAANCVSDNDDDDQVEIETKELLQSLLLEGTSNNNNDDDKISVRQSIRDEIEIGLGLIIGDYTTTRSNTNHDLKRNLMAHLRDKGFDAGVCKSRWEKRGRIQAGSYEYIDVKLGQARYIVEVFLAAQFEIARPTHHYTTLLQMIPTILVLEKPNVLKQILRVVSNAMKKSMQHVSMHVPPWRRNSYIQAKYFSPYKRTTNREPSATKLMRVGPEKKSKSKAGFETSNNASYCYCRDTAADFVSKGGGLRVGLLASLLQGNY